MAKKKAKAAKKSAPKKNKPAKKPAAKKAAAKKSKPAKMKPGMAAKKKSPPIKNPAAKKPAAKKPAAKKPAAKKPAPRPQRTSAPAFYVRIDHATQGPDGHETPADRLTIRSDDFLWLYVESNLPGGAAPQGEYSKTPGGMPQPLGSPDNINGQYRFMVIHFTLSPASTYQFRFADNLAAPAHQDQWEVVTVAG